MQPAPCLLQNEAYGTYMIYFAIKPSQPLTNKSAAATCAVTVAFTPRGILEASHSPSGCAASSPRWSFYTCAAASRESGRRSGSKVLPLLRVEREVPDQPTGWHRSMTLRNIQLRNQAT